MILFTTYLQVEVSVAVTNWYGPFYDLVQAALSRTAHVTLAQFYAGILTFLWIALAAVTVGVLTAFFVSHYVFRWRTAMNAYYMAHWPQLRLIEGAAQRVQEDTMRFSTTTEDLGGSLITSVMTLIAFLPVLARLGANIKVLPLIGPTPYALVVAAILWSLFGTLFLAAIGVKLPGLQYRNQRVEAAYRKELIYGEDDPERARPATVEELFARVRENYFRLYFNYAYFNVGRILYLQADNVFGLVILAPTIVAGGQNPGRVRCRLSMKIRPLFQLRLLQRRPDPLSTGGQRLRPGDPRPDHRRRRDHAGPADPNPVRLRSGAVIVPVSGQFLDDDRGTGVDLQTPAVVRGGDRRRAASGDRPRAAARLGAIRSGWRALLRRLFHASAPGPAPAMASAAVTTGRAPRRARRPGSPPRWRPAGPGRRGCRRSRG